MKIAIVGTGISGLTVAHHLYDKHQVTIFEADSRAGGHANTVRVSDGIDDLAIDTGFIVFNERNYPGFIDLLNDLQVESQPSTMSFGVVNETTDLEYAGTSVRAMFAQARNLFQPRFYRLLTEIRRFGKLASALVENESVWNENNRLVNPINDQDETLKDFLERNHFSRAFTDDFLVPFGAAIWSADPTQFNKFPALAYARFMKNHGLLDFRNRPKWRTIANGSRQYVQALSAPFASAIHLNTPVHSVSRTSGSLLEVSTDGARQQFDAVVIATHSNQALSMLQNPTPDQARILGSIRYRQNSALLHTDTSILPKSRAAWAAWNYRSTKHQTSPIVTYRMNALQNLKTVSNTEWLVSLNADDLINPDTCHYSCTYAHPVFDTAAMRAQSERHTIQGAQNIYFAGAYWGYGFHEDGVQSALEVVRSIEAATKGRT